MRRGGRGGYLFIGNWKGGLICRGVHTGQPSSYVLEFGFAGAFWDGELIVW